MNIEIINKLDEITELIKKDDDLKEMRRLEEEILNDKNLLNDIEKLKNMPEYSSLYLKLKEKIFSNEKFKRYKQLEKEYYFFSREISKKLNSFSEKSGCK